MSWQNFCENKNVVRIRTPNNLRVQQRGRGSRPADSITTSYDINFPDVMKITNNQNQLLLICGELRMKWLNYTVCWDNLRFKRSKHVMPVPNLCLLLIFRNPENSIQDNTFIWKEWNQPIQINGWLFITSLQAFWGIYWRASRGCHLLSNSCLFITVPDSLASCTWLVGLE